MFRLLFFAVLASRVLAGGPDVLVTSDLRGRMQGEGGLPQRAALLGKLRQESSNLLLEAGNVFYGAADSAEALEIIAELYAQLDYDAINLAPADVSGDLEALRKAISRFDLPVISANVLNKETGEPLFPPGRSIILEGISYQIIGLCAPPYGSFPLPSGVKVGDPAEALERELKRSSDPVIVLFHGSPLVALQAIRSQGDRIRAVALNGEGTADRLAGIPVVFGGREGRRLARLSLSEAQPVTQVYRLDAGDPVDADLERLVKTRLEQSRENQAKRQALLRPGSSEARPDADRDLKSTSVGGPVSSLDPALYPETIAPLTLSPIPWQAPTQKGESEENVVPPGEGVLAGKKIQGTDVLLTAHRFFILDSYYGEAAGDGEVWLAVEVELSMLPGRTEPVQISDLESKILLRMNQRSLQEMRSFRGTAPQFPNQVVLDRDSPSVRNFIFYPVPIDDVTSAELLLTEPEGAPQVIQLLPEGGTLEEPNPVHEERNQVAILGLFGAEIRDSFQGRSRSGESWVVVDVRGRSVMQSPDSGEGLQLIWREWRPRLQLIVDGVKAWAIDSNDFVFDRSSRLLPGLNTGGLFAFHLPSDVLEKASVVQLQCGFAPVAIPGDRVRPVETLHFTLKGDPDELPPPPAPLYSLDDLDFKIDVVEASRPETIFDREAVKGKSWVRVKFGVEGLAEAGVWFSSRETLNLIRSNRSVLPIHRYTYQGEEVPPNNGYTVWIPKGGRREFAMIWEVPDEAGIPRLRIEGIKRYEAMKLFPDEEADDGLVLDPETNRTIDENGLQVLRPSAEPGGIESVGLQPLQVNEAIDRGRDFLWEKLQEEWGGLAPRSYRGEHVLAILALVHADAHLEYPDFDKTLRRFLQVTRIKENTVYANALVAMIIEAYGDTSFFPKMEQVAHWLVETQGEEGTWTYSAPVPARFFPETEPEEEKPDRFLTIDGGEILEPYTPPAVPIHRTQPWELGKDGDHSCTQFAVLGLWSAERSGVEIDPEVWKRVVTRMARHQTLREGDRYGGYGYSGQGGAYGSMTAAGICTLAISIHRLFDDLTPREHLRIRNALGWMVRNFTVKENPESERYNYYYIYSVERVGQILGIDFMGDHEWYPVGAKYLVDTQSEDGSWPTGSEEAKTLLTTSYALLFLTRATPELDAEPEPEPKGPGTLVTQVERPEVRPRVYLILDVSGSMRAPLNGKMKIDIARGAVRDMLEALPENSRVAVRVYGHRKRAIDPGADEDTELIVPWGEVDVENIMGILEALEPRGKTPMAISLRQAADDIRRNDGETVLVLLTDGGERSRTTNPIKEASAFADREEVSFFLLGFDINQEDWTEQLKGMAEAGKGVYRSAAEADELTYDLRAAVFPPVPGFEVLDANGNVVAASEFGAAALELEVGDYSLRAKTPDFSLPFRIRPGGQTRITLDMARMASALADSDGAGDVAPVKAEKLKVLSP